MNLVKTSYFTFIATFIKILSSLIINKAISIFIGPKGLSLIGQFQNFSQLAMISSQGGINSGVTKYVAEYKEDRDKLLRCISSSYRITFISTLLSSILIIVFAKFEARYFLNDISYTYIFIIFGFSVFFISLNSLLLSILNGLQEVKSYVKINILQSIVSLAITVLLIKYLGIHGVLIALVSNQSIVFLFLLFLFKKHRILNELFVFSFFDKYESKKLLYYSLMTITSAIATPLSLILIRNKIIEKCGIEESGIWQAIWYISSMHLMVITTTLSVYYLPKLSSITDARLLRKEIFSGYKIIIPFVIVSASFIFLMKDYIVNILFTPKFSVIKDLLLFQMIGDVIKISSWLLSYIMVAKAMTKVFIFTEIFFNAIFVLLSFLFVTYFGLIGMTYSYLINYVLYFVFLLFVFRKVIF